MGEPWVRPVRSSGIGKPGNCPIHDVRLTRSKSDWEIDARGNDDPTIAKLVRYAHPADGAKTQRIQQRQRDRCSHRPLDPPLPSVHDSHCQPHAERRIDNTKDRQGCGHAGHFTCGDMCEGMATCAVTSEQAASPVPRNAGAWSGSEFGLGDPLAAVDGQQSANRGCGELVGEESAAAAHSRGMGATGVPAGHSVA